MYSFENHLEFLEESLEKLKEQITYMRENEHVPTKNSEAIANFLRGDLNGSIFVLRDWAEKEKREDVLKRLAEIELKSETL